MKKRIVALIGALTLVFAMGLNAAAAGSIDSKEVQDEITTAVSGGKVEGFPTSSTALTEQASAAEKLVSGATVTPLTDATAAVALAKDAAALKTDNVESVKVVFVVEVTSEQKEVEVAMTLAANEKAYALHVKADGTVEKLPGTVKGDKVVFTSESWSPVAVIRVTEKAQVTTPSNNNNNTSSPAAPAAPAAAVAPKTGDMVMMVSIMAVIFMAGAAVAVFMSKKRA